MSAPSILIVGVGMLGSAVRSASWTARYATVAASRKAAGAQAIDLTSDASVDSFFDKNGPFAVVINCAAEANVDACEKEPEAARQVNALGVRRLARNCRRTGAAFLHISTDYVFDGAASRPYSEEDPVGPRSIYGTTKLEGEFYALSDTDGVTPEVSAVIRTTWIFGGTRTDFVNGIVDRLQRGENPGVVDNQTASPAYAADLADAIGVVVEKHLLPARAAKRAMNRLYHCANHGQTTRHGMAVRIAQRLGRPADLPRVAARDITSWVAVRPKYTVLNTERIARECGVRMRPWEDALDAFLASKRDGTTTNTVSGVRP